MASLRFYFDFISPYAYLGWKAIGPLAARHDRTLEPVPILFAALLDHHGHRGPAEIPPKRQYIFKHVMRLAHDAGVPLAPPPAHPFNPLLALRIAGLPQDPAAKVHVIDTLFDATWGGGPGIEDPEVVTNLLAKAGLDGRHLVANAKEPEAKARLKTATREAIDLGVFGVPTVDVDGELFWGTDAYPHVEQFLDGRDPLPDDLISRWQDLPASAVRKGSAS